MVRVGKPTPIVSWLICKYFSLSFDSLEAELQAGADFGSLGDARKIASRLERVAQHSGDTPRERGITLREWEIFLDKTKF